MHDRKLGPLLTALAMSLFVAFAARASALDVPVTVLSGADFHSGTAPSSATSYALGASFSLTQDFSTLYYDGPPLGPSGSLDGLSDGSFGTSYGTTPNTFSDVSHYVLSIGTGNAASQSDYFGCNPTAGAYQWTLSYFTQYDSASLSTTCGQPNGASGLLGAEMSTIMKGTVTDLGAGVLRLDVAQGIEWFVNPINIGSATVPAYERLGAKLADFGSLTLDTRSGTLRADLVPEPGTLVLLALGLSGLAAVRRRGLAPVGC